MFGKWQWMLLQFSRRMWVRAALFAVLGVLTALLAIYLEPFLGDKLPTQIGAGSVEKVLTIIASSMLAVTTFSLSIMVSAYGAASSSVTPRATQLLIEDTTTQNVLAVFIGSFLFSLVGIVALNTGYYGDRGRFVLFLVTIGVIMLVVVTILRWIDHLTLLGRVGETTARVEKAAMAAISARRKYPFLGGMLPDLPLSDQLRTGAPLRPDCTGYVQHVDIGKLQAAANKYKVRILVAALPGAYVYPAREIAFALSDQDASLSIDDSAALAKVISGAFSIGQFRSFAQDPRFGMVVMSEIASRALSPAVNDPGTAIDVLGRALRLLHQWVRPDTDIEKGDEVCNRIFVPALSSEEMFADFFAPIARDGAGIFEVQIRLQKTLLGLAHMGDAAAKSAALAQSRGALEHALSALVTAGDKARLRAVAADVETVCRGADPG